MVPNITLEARGGNGGNNQSSSCAQFGSGGAGGSLRIVAHRVIGSANLNLGGGFRPGDLLRSAGGLLRVETDSNEAQFTIDGVGGGSYISFPTAPVPTNQPLLRITQLNGQAAPPAPRALLSAPDVSFASSVETPVSVTVQGMNVPLGTAVNIKVVPAAGAVTTAVTTGLTGSVGDSTAQATVSLPPGAGIITATATFTVTPPVQGALFPNGLPTIDGEKPDRVEVTAMADGKSHTFLLTPSGRRLEFGRAQ